MTSPRLASDSPHGRLYARTRGGTPEHPSITTILGTLNQDMGWWEALCATNTAFQYAPNLLRVSQSTDWKEQRRAKDWIKDSATRDRDAAAARGDLVHDYAECWALHTLGQATDDDLEQHRNACEQGGAEAYLPHFHRFWDEWKPQVVAPEATVWNETIGYAGTTDLMFRLNINGRQVNVIGDYKTKKGLFLRNGAPKDNDLKPYTGMQLAAAAQAEEIWHPGQNDDGTADTWEPMTFEAEVGVGIAIAPDGYAVRQYNIADPAMMASFKALRQAWEFYRQGENMMSPRLDGPEKISLP